MDKEGISDRKVEIRVRRNGRKDKVIIEKSAAEGLPEGWIKKLVISNRTGRKIRRDPFFIDPKSGYVFHSFKDASRYVETGIVGNYARKLKESDTEVGDPGSGKTVLPLESVQQKSAYDLLGKEKKINIYVRSSKRRNLSSSDEHPKNCELKSNLCNVTSQVCKDMGKKEKTKDPIENQHVAKRVTRSQAKANKNEEHPDLKTNNMCSSKPKSEKGKESVVIVKKEKVEDSSVTRITRSKAKVKKNELSDSVVRRASKRLAGIELEPTPELKTRTKARRVTPPDVGTASKCKQPVNPVATDGLKKTDIPLNKEVAKSYNEHSSPKPNAATTTSNNCVTAEMEVQVEKISKTGGRNGSGDKDMKMPLVISEVEVSPVFHLDGYKEKKEMSPVSPLTHQTYATNCEKTTARRRMGRSSSKAKFASEVGSWNESETPSDNSKSIQRRDRLGNNSSKFSVVRGACSKAMEKNSSSFSAFDSTLADMWKDPCIAFAIKTLMGESLHPPSSAAIASDPQNNDTKQKEILFFPETPGTASTGTEKERVYSDIAGGDIWKDPCIDFAIKTLTGAIPIGLEEADVKSKSEATTQEQEGKQISCDDLVGQCSDKMKKTVGNSGDQRFTQSFFKD